MLFLPFASSDEGSSSRGSGLKKWLSLKKASSSIGQRKSFDKIDQHGRQLPKHGAAPVGVASTNRNEGKSASNKRFGRHSLPATACLPMGGLAKPDSPNPRDFDHQIAGAADVGGGRWTAESQVSMLAPPPPPTVDAGEYGCDVQPHSERMRALGISLGCAASTRSGGDYATGRQHMPQTEKISNMAANGQIAKPQPPRRKRSLIYAMYHHSSKPEEDSAAAGAEPTMPTLSLAPPTRLEQQLEHRQQQRQQQTLRKSCSTSTSDSFSTTFASCQGSLTGSERSQVHSCSSIPFADFGVALSSSTSLSCMHSGCDNTGCSAEPRGRRIRSSTATSEACSEGTAASTDSGGSSNTGAQLVGSAYRCSERHMPRLSTIERAHDGRLVIKPSSEALGDSSEALPQLLPVLHAHVADEIPASTAASGGACVADSNESPVKCSPDAANEEIRRAAVDGFPPVAIGCRRRLCRRADREPNDSLVIHASKLRISAASSTCSSTESQDETQRDLSAARGSIITPPDSPDKACCVASAAVPVASAVLCQPLAVPEKEKQGPTAGVAGTTPQQKEFVADTEVLAPCARVGAQSLPLMWDSGESRDAGKVDSVQQAKTCAAAGGEDGSFMRMIALEYQSAMATSAPVSSASHEVAQKVAVTEEQNWPFSVVGAQTESSDAGGGCCGTADAATSAEVLDVAGDVASRPSESERCSLLSTADTAGGGEDALGLSSASEGSATAVDASANTTNGSSTEEKEEVGSICTATFLRQSVDGCRASVSDGLPTAQTQSGNNGPLSECPQTDRGIYSGLHDAKMDDDDVFCSDSETRVLSILSDVSDSDLPLLDLSHAPPPTSTRSSNSSGLRFRAQHGGARNFHAALDPTATIFSGEDSAINSSGSGDLALCKPRTTRMVGSKTMPTTKTGLSSAHLPLTAASTQSQAPVTSLSTIASGSSAGSCGYPDGSTLSISAKTRRLTTALASVAPLSGLRHLRRKMKATGRWPSNYSGSSSSSSGSSGLSRSVTSYNGSGNKQVSVLHTSKPGNPASSSSKVFRFNELVAVYETWDASDYDRKGPAAIKLDSELIEHIKRELNEFKVYEMSVHEESRSNTHLIY
ncbi:hypothetical protein GQ54DRAFT_330272 [Martensiomyces pterosporus]|nr:hypothetical protein GQ54DRAFT_330272 [Martensiomyces pterosporus]